MFCMKSWIVGHRIHQLGGTANSNRFSPIQAKSGALPSWWILCPSIQDFIQDVFITLEACSFNILLDLLIGFSILFNILLMYCDNISYPLLKLRGFFVRLWREQLYFVDYNFSKLFPSLDDHSEHKTSNQQKREKGQRKFKSFLRLVAVIFTTFRLLGNQKEKCFQQKNQIGRKVRALFEFLTLEKQ